MKPGNFSARFELTREGGRTRSLDVTARRYRDGAFEACIRAPSAHGSTLHTVELSPREVSDTRQLVAATASTLRTALRDPTRDTVGGYGVDIVGELARVVPRTSRGVARGIGQSWDVVGGIAETLRGAASDPRFAGMAAGLQGAGGAVGAGALAGLTGGGGLEGAARGAVEGLGRATGLGEASQAIGGAIGTALGYDLGTLDATERQARRDRALRELAQVAPTHDATNWRGAVSYHVSNGGLMPFGRGASESDQLLSDRSVLSQLPRQHPQLTDPNAPNVLGAAGPARMAQTIAQMGAGALGSESLAGVGATGAGTIDAQIRAVNAAAAAAGEPAPGTAGAAAVSAVPASVAGAALGAGELLARALATLALETQGRDAQTIADAAQVARVALRSVDAIAGARAGDPRARAAIRNAVNASSDRVARGLRVGLALVGA